MTYRELLEALKELSPEELELTATVVVDDEVYAVSYTDKISENEVLDDEHPILVVE